MALLKDFYEPLYQMTFSDCYWKIDTENGITGGKTMLRIRFHCYKDKAAADTNAGKYGYFDTEFIPNLDSRDNFIAQAYNYAKTLPFFIGSIDV
jgi:hypothetical protein